MNDDGGMVELFEVYLLRIESGKPEAERAELLIVPIIVQQRK